MLTLAGSSFVVTLEQYDEYVRTEWKLLAERRLANPSIVLADLARALGYNPNTVRIWLAHPRYQRYENWLIEQRREELVGLTGPLLPSPRFSSNTIPERFQEYAAEMQERLLDLIETAASEKLQAELVEKWLAFGGTVPKSLPGGSQSGPIISAERMIVFLQRAREVELEVPSLTALLPARKPDS